MKIARCAVYFIPFMLYFI